MNITQQPKPNPKGKAVASLILGVITIILFSSWLVEFWCSISPVDSIGCYLHRITLRIISAFPTGSTGVIIVIIYILQISFLPIIGFILGILGLKSTKKNLALIGIILCAISFIGEIIFLLYGLLYSLGL